jgi:hypothetical protein
MQKKPRPTPVSAPMPAALRRTLVTVG